ncbi:MAG: hypothetical protein LKJ86_08830 [Oscillibacter sp.]|jgi:hypothetical protein|nr:hypothetical protein [Oscillibacter sp.]
MKKTIELCKVRQGETFTLDGVEFVKLDEAADCSFVLTSDVALKNIPFEDEDAEREDHNNFCGSNIEKAMERWLRENHKPIFDASQEYPIDLTTMDGMTDYGAPLSGARLLTIDEYRKYRRFIPLASERYWLATGWTTASSPLSGARIAYRVVTGGALSNDRVYRAGFAARPALYLKSSILVSIETENGQEEKTVRDFTDTELMDELYRRRRESYDAD